jgi:hypothetical protein
VQVGPEVFAEVFGSDNLTNWPAEIQARQFFAQGGEALHVIRVDDSLPLAEALRGDVASFTGIHALTILSDLRILVVPELSLVSPMDFGRTLVSIRVFTEPRRIFFILDPPPGLTAAAAAVEWVQGSIPDDADFAAIYFPYLQVELSGQRLTIGASGTMAAVLAANDVASGIWDSPAGTSLPLAVELLSPVLNSTDYELLNVNHVNGIRDFAGIGIVPWGSRTLDRSDPENRYIAPVRTRDWINASLDRALAFTAVEDNAMALWEQVRLLIGGFLNDLYRSGAFQGATPSEAYFVRCDSTTTTEADIEAGRVNALYGAAYIRPAEFDLSMLSSRTFVPRRPVPRTSMRFHASPGHVELAYPTEPGFGWQLEVKEDLQAETWKANGPVQFGDGAWRKVSLPTEMGQAYYQLQVTPLR